MRKRISVTGDDDDAGSGQNVIGCTVGGSVVQSGRGSQNVTGSTVAGDVVQSGTGSE
jgi:hypothetical protein